MTAESTTDTLAAWETSSEYWNKHQSTIERMFAPITTALIEAAEIRVGHSVVDIGGGTGEPSLTIATVVGPSGSVTYTDPSAGMGASARGEALRRGLKNISFQQAPAQALPFEDSTFDRAVGRLSAMFIPDVGDGVREVLRVVKPGGCVSFLVWSYREANPFFSRISDVLNRFVPPEPEDEDAPAAFRFARRGKLAGVFRDAGIDEVDERVVDWEIRAPLDIDQFWELRTEMSDTFRSKLAQLGTEKIAAVKSETREAVAGFFKSGEMIFPAQVLIVSGKKNNSTDSAR